MWPQAKLIKWSYAGDCDVDRQKPLSHRKGINCFKNIHYDWRGSLCAWNLKVMNFVHYFSGTQFEISGKVQHSMAENLEQFCEHSPVFRSDICFMKLQCECESVNVHPCNIPCKVWYLGLLVPVCLYLTYFSVKTWLSAKSEDNLIIDFYWSCKAWKITEIPPCLT